VLAASGKNLVVRISWLFGRGKAAFPEWIIHKSCAEPVVTLPYDKIGCPTSCEDLIQALLSLSCNRARDAASGVFNFCNPEPCTWQEWGQFCIDTAKQAGLPVLGEKIQGVAMSSVPAFTAQRPLNSAMCIKKFVEFSGYSPRSWQEAVREHLLSGDLFREYTSTRM
jgi:dTDP-4-dehydrorhamnose reductase